MESCSLQVKHLKVSNKPTLQGKQRAMVIFRLAFLVFQEVLLVFLRPGVSGLRQAFALGENPCRRFSGFIGVLQLLLTRCVTSPFELAIVCSFPILPARPVGGSSSPCLILGVANKFSMFSLQLWSLAAAAVTSSVQLISTELYFNLCRRRDGVLPADGSLNSGLSFDETS